LSLDTLGMLYGTDKSMLRQNYLDHYERLFAGLRDEVFTLLEIGIYTGASLALWRTYFRYAKIVGVDIDPRCGRYAGDRIKVEIGSQADGQFLGQVVARHRPTIIIDDGSHQSEHQIFTFETLFPQLPAAGHYIIEDLSNEPSPLHGVSGAAYFGKLQEGLAARWRPSADYAGLPAWALLTDISEIVSFRGAVAFHKASPVDSTQDIPWIEDLVERSGKPESWLFFAEYLQSNGWLTRALAVAQRAATLMPDDPWSRSRVSQILATMRDLDGARVAAQRAVELAPNDPRFRAMLDGLSGAGPDAEGPTSPTGGHTAC
jgi:hypothetical protein